MEPRNLMIKLYVLHLQLSFLRGKFVIFAPIRSTPLKEKAATITRSSPPLGALFIVGYGKKLVSFIVHKIILSGNGAVLLLLVVQSVWC